MAVFKRGGVWWYKFYFAGQFIRESAKSTSKTVAKDAENPLSSLCSICTLSFDLRRPNRGHGRVLNHTLPYD